MMAAVMSDTNRLVPLATAGFILLWLLLSISFATSAVGATSVGMAVVVTPVGGVPSMTVAVMAVGV